MVGTVEDGTITTAKLADGAVVDAKVCDTAAIVKTKLAALEIDNEDVASDAAIAASKLSGVVAGTGTSGDKAITKIGWKSSTGEFVLDHEA
jgi:hypothetical protein